MVPYLLLITIMPLVGMIFVFTAKDNEKTKGRNVLNVAILTVGMNLFLIVRALNLIKPGYGNLQLSESYNWINTPQINLSFGADSFAMLLIFGVHLAVLIGMWGVRNAARGQKPRMVFVLLFLSMINGFFMAADIFSFFIFFEALLLPLYMMVGMFGEARRRNNLFRFMLYNLCGAFLLFAAIVVLYNHGEKNLLLGGIKNLHLGSAGETAVWTAIFIAFMSRIPIWPFHSWIASVNSGIKDPLVFISANIMPLTGIYGFMRFWPKPVPDTIVLQVAVLEVVSVITMLFIALIAWVNRDIRYKIFSFASIYYIFFLLGVFLPTDQILLNVGYSLFACLLIFASMEVLVSYQLSEQSSKNLSAGGILSSMPKMSKAFSFMMLAGAGFPLSAMFINNFVIMAGLMNYSLVSALAAAAALLLISVTLLQELYRRKDEINPVSALSLKDKAKDISGGDLFFMTAVGVILLLSLFNPVWFMKG